MEIRDWKWIVGILSGIIVFLLSYKFWGKSDDLTEIISISTGLASISLAVTAIIIAVAEGVKTSSKEQKVDGALDRIIANLSTMKELINILKNDNYKTHDQLSKIYDIRKAYNETDDLTRNKPEGKEQEVKDSHLRINTQDINSIQDVKRGEVYFAELPTTVGSEQGGIRPVVIIQNEMGNKFSPVVTVAPVTAQIQKAKLPVHVVIDAKRYGLESDSVILLEQIKTIDKARLKDKITLLDDEIMKRIDNAVSIQLGLIDF